MILRSERFGWAPSPLEGEGRFERSEKRGEGLFAFANSTPHPARSFAPCDPLPQGVRVKHSEANR